MFHIDSRDGEEERMIEIMLGNGQVKLQRGLLLTITRYQYYSEGCGGFGDARRGPIRRGYCIKRHGFRFSRSWRPQVFLNLDHDMLKMFT